MVKLYSGVLLVITFFYMPFANAEFVPDTVELYGTSIHFDNNRGKGYNEFNYGLGGNWGVYDDEKNHSFLINAGAFNNSYNDLAYWVGARYVWDMNDILSVGVNARHWETLNNTYKNRVVELYPEVGLKLSDSVKLNSIIRLSGFIFYLEIKI